MTHPCFAQKICKSRINDWKLKINPRRDLGSTRPRAIGSAAAGRRGGNIGAANPARREIFGMKRRSWGRLPAPRQLARRPVQPTVADPHRGDHQNEHNELRKCKHNRGLSAARKRGEGGHNPNLAHIRRVSNQSTSSATSETGSRPTNGTRLRNGKRRLSAEMGRSLTLSPYRVRMTV